jgi:hypothetical protein
MTTSTAQNSRPSRRRPLSIGLAVLVVLLIAAIVAIALTSQGAGRGTATDTSAPDPSSTPTAADTSPATPSPTASAPSEPDPRPTNGRPLPFDETAEVQNDVVLQLAELESVAGEASQPGEVAGPSLRFTVRVENRSDSEVSLVTAAVNAYYGEELTPAIPLQNPGGRPFPESVAAGESADGVFVFSVPAESRDIVRLTLDFSVDEPLIVFEGSAPR